MRLYILAIGGSGSRVLKSMVMQFAAGVLPLDPVTNKPMTDVSVVPIIIDPHMKNDAVQTTDELLNRYCTIRRSLYGDEPTRKGFFGVKILSLKDTVTDKDNHSTYSISDSFIFNMPPIVSSNTFGEFIGISERAMSEEGNMLSKILFSKEELKTEMSEGFYGSPNIGTIALNVFKLSDSYQVMGNGFSQGDRLFFIGSIFGGTGAAGLPMLVSSIRQDSYYTAMRDAFMGALVVMPYFSIQPKENSEIQENDFIIKTKTALKYYTDNLYPYLNCIYYVADDDKENTIPFENDPGKDNQKSNKAHFVEFIGGMSIFNFLHQVAKGDGMDAAPNQQKSNRNEGAGSKKYMQFQLKEDSKTIGFPDLSKETNEQIFTPMAAFHFMMRFLTSGEFDKNLSATFAKDRGIDASAVTGDIYRFLETYGVWLREMGSHGENAHNFIPFLYLTKLKDYSNEINGVPMKRGPLGTKKFESADIIKKMNKSEAFSTAQTPSGKLFMLLYDAMEKSLPEYFDLTNVY